MKVKSIVLSAALFGLAPMSYGFPSLEGEKQAITVVSVADLDQYEEILSRHFSAEFIEFVRGATARGTEFTFTFSDEITDGGGSSGRDNYCTVKVKESTSGSGNANVGVRGVGGSAGGQGSTTREYEVSGPCESVERIVHEMNGNQGRNGGHGGQSEI